jgi:hypothetical protein
VLVRQRPGSANGVLFITLEDETEIANLIIWPSLFERQRRLILSANMIGCRGKVQREGQVIHVIAEHLIDLSALLNGVGERNAIFPLPHCRGDEAKHGSGPDPRGTLGRKPRDIYVPNRRIEAAIKRETFGEAGVRPRDDNMCSAPLRRAGFQRGKAFGLDRPSISSLHPTCRIRTSIVPAGAMTDAVVRFVPRSGRPG